MAEPPVHAQPFAGYQAEIFLLGMGGQRPEHPVSIVELERLAEERIQDPRAAAYVFGGAGREETMRSNLEAFRRWRIVPADAARRLRPRPLGDRAQHPDAGARGAGARSALQSDPAPRRRARRRSRRRRPSG